MKTPGKACPIVMQQRDKKRYVLAFTHPTAGKQFVKGTIEADESPLDGAVRELKEESGLDANVPLIPLGKTNICLLYTSPSPRDRQKSRMPSSA